MLTSFVETVSSYNEFLSYEENGRITQYKRGPTANPTIHDYTYWTNPEQSFDFNRVSFITGWNDQSPGNYTYDFSGNMTGDDEKDLSLTWDYKNQPVRADFTPEYLKFRYDAKDNRIKKEYYDGQDTEITRYLWSGSHPIVELYADGSMKNLNIYAGDNLIAHRSFIPGAICEGALNCFADPDFHCIPENCEFVPGDVDGNGVGLELADVIYLIAWTRGTGLPPPPPMSRGDVDCDGVVGLSDVTKIIACYNGTDTPDCCYYHCGMLYYHLNDHLGSTRVLTDSTGRMYAAYDYYATGDKTDLNWVYKGTNYQYTGKEYDEESGFNMNYFGARYYDPKAVMFISVDPELDEYPGWSPYVYTQDNPLRFVDPDGRLQIPANQASQYPKLTEYIKNRIGNVVNNPRIANPLMKHGEFTQQQLNKALTWGSGPTINVTNLNNANGAFTPNIGSTELRLDTKIVQQLENAQSNDVDAALLLVGSTALHELTHYGDDQDRQDRPGDEGEAFEVEAYGQDIDNLNDAKNVIQKQKQTQQQVP